MAKTLTVAGTWNHDDEPGTPDQAEQRVLDAAAGILTRLQSLVKEQITAKGSIESRWLEDLRLYYGIYDETFRKGLEEQKRSTAFVKLTRNKTNGWEARLADLLFPTDDRNWGIKPTPVPKLIAAAKEATATAQASVTEANQAADEGDPARAAQIAEQANSYAQQVRQSEAEVADAKKRCDRMQTMIEDQLEESNYSAVCRDVIGDGCRIGTGILKGPLTANRLRSEWREGQAGFDLAQIPDPMPEFVRVDPWHFFPDMSARTIQEAEFTFERSLPTKKDLRRYALKFGFNRKAVSKLLKDGPAEICASDMTNLRDLRAIAKEGDPIRNRYVQWEYHGPLECEEVATLLRAAGQEDAAREYEEEKDPFDENRVIIHFIENDVLKIVAEYPMESGDGLYSVWNFEKGETSVFGYGVPNASNDSQRMVNGAWRMMSDNSSLSVGPQIVIDKGAIKPQDGLYSLRALKVWLKTSATAQTPGNPPFEVFNIPNNQQQLAGIIELGKQFMDEETSLPPMAQGEPGAQVQPVGTTAMLFNSANVVFRRVVKSFDDDLTSPTIRRAYDWNMQFNADETIKGDMQVAARGTSVLLVREIQSQNLLNIVTNWSVHPVIGAYLKVYEALEQTLQCMMLPPDEILFTQDEAEKRQATAAAQSQPQAEEAPLDTRLEVAKIEADARLQVATMSRDIEMMKLSQQTGIALEDIRAKLEGKKIEVESKERIKAADIGVEAQRGEQAVAEGVPATEAVGQGIG